MQELAPIAVPATTRSAVVRALGRTFTRLGHKDLGINIVVKKRLRAALLLLALPLERLPFLFLLPCVSTEPASILAHAHKRVHAG
eukprot:6737159-Prymnesium_polylepis.1